MSSTSSSSNNSSSNNSSSNNSSSNNSSSNNSSSSNSASSHKNNINNSSTNTASPTRKTVKKGKKSSLISKSKSTNSLVIKILLALVFITILGLICYFLHLKKIIHIPFFPKKDDKNDRL